MRIGISATWLSTTATSSNSGLSRYTYNLIEQMSKDAPHHEFVVFAPQSFSAPDTWNARPNLKVLSVTPTSLAKRVLWEHFAPRGLAKEHKLDVWFSAAHVIPIGSPIPTAVMIHDVIPLIYPEHHVARTVLYYRWAFKHAARKSTRVLTNSESTRDDLVRLFGIDPSKVIVTRAGPGNLAPPDHEEFRKLNVPEPYLLALGNLEWRKNLHGLVEAFTEVSRHRPDLHLVIVGARRMSSENLVDERIAELGVGDRVHFTGYAPDAALPDLYCRSAAFVFPSYYEGFGLPVLEALLYGAIVASSNRSSLPEVGGDAAIYFDPDSKDSMVAAILAALDVPDREERLVAGVERARKFNWAQTARDTLRALEGIA